MLRALFGLIVIAGFTASCADVPDVDTPLQFACNTADDCLEDYECGSNRFCQPGPSASGCTSEASVSCEEDNNIWWVDSCGEPHALQSFCDACCSEESGTPTCVSCGGTVSGGA